MHCVCVFASFSLPFRAGVRSLQANPRLPLGDAPAHTWHANAHAFPPQGVRLGSEEARDLLPRLLLLLSFDDAASDGAVGGEVSKAVAAGDIPSWVWFAWVPQVRPGSCVRADKGLARAAFGCSLRASHLPAAGTRRRPPASSPSRNQRTRARARPDTQLLTSLSRPEGPRVKPILKELAQHHPQAVYYWTRVLIITSRCGPRGGRQGVAAGRRR
jgi:hypothetical protein